MRYRLLATRCVCGTPLVSDFHVPRKENTSGYPVGLCKLNILLYIHEVEMSLRQLATS